MKLLIKRKEIETSADGTADDDSGGFVADGRGRVESNQVCTAKFCCCFSESTFFLETDPASRPL